MLIFVQAKEFYDITIKTMDSTLPSNPYHLFAYCITDGLLDDMCPEQRASTISVIESLLSGGEDAISECLLSGEDANENKSIFVCFDRKNQKVQMDLNDLIEHNLIMNPTMTTTDIRAAIYARVSSTGDRQSTERQVIDLTDYANKNGMTVCHTFEEHISGAKKNHERPVLKECLTYCIDEQIDVLLLSELSRLGRNVDEVLANIRFAKDNHLNIHFQKEGISIYGADDKENPYLTIMIAVLGTCAQMERENIQYRLQSGRKVYVERNLTETGKSGLGRKVGYRKPIERKKEEYKETLKLLKAGYPIRKVAKLSDVSESTVKRLKREFCI